MRFEWDDAKSERTRANRGIDFTYAPTVFSDANRIEGEARTVNGETRFSIVGKAAGALSAPGGTMRAKKSAALSQPERLVRRSEADIFKYADSAEAKATAKRLKASGPDPTDADLEEIPALTDKELAAMRPVKQAITVRLDSDIVAWLKESSDRYQTRMNAILRAVMLRQRR